MPLVGGTCSVRVLNVCVWLEDGRKVVRLMRKTNVLVFPAGEINSVELHDALSHNVNIRVFGCSSTDRHGGFVFKNYRSGLPNIMKDGFLESFNSLLDEWKIDYIFPTHDTVALFLAQHQDLIHAKVIMSDLHTAEICRDKYETYRLFADCSFCPEVFNDFSHFPVFIKPKDGQGAKGAKLITSKEDIPTEIHAEDIVICENLPGKEMTVDCLTDSHGNLVACLPRVRNRLMAGVCVAGKAEQATDEILQIATTINHRMNFLGLWYFQIKQSKEGKYKLLEISTRTAGTMCLSRARGINLPLLSVYAAQGKDISVFDNPYLVYMDRTLISRYALDYEYDRVYIDYDDTVIENDDVCLPVIKFLYQCRNKGIKIVLITRHEADHEDSIEDSLKKHAISIELFDEIIKLSFEQEKSDYITGSRTIFIDNAYSERKKVHHAIGIPVFDIEGIEVVEDWRC